MPRTATYWGRIQPERMPIALNVPLHFSGDVRNAEGEAHLDARVEDSQFRVEVTCDDPLDALAFRSPVEEFMEAMTDTIGYVSFRAYDLDLIGVTWEGGMHVFQPRADALASKVGAVIDHPVQIWQLATEHVQLRKALSNLREAMKMIHDTGFFAHRAIEAVSAHFCTTEEPHINQGKAKMQTAICVSEAWVKKASRFGGDQRHGKVVPMTGTERLDAIAASWRVVDRFICYLMNGEKPLDSSVFPQL
jgi:hypothetical protein